MARKPRPPSAEAADAASDAGVESSAEPLVRDVTYRSADGLAFSGVLIEPIYYPTFGPWVISTALFLALVATVLASLYPAWFASRTDPAAALRMDR